MRGKRALDLSYLDAEPANLHLVIQTAEVFDAAVRKETRQITCAIKPRSRQTAERIRHKPLRCQIRAPVITTRQLYPTNVQFARNTRRNRMQVFIEQIDLRVRDRPPDRHACVSARGITSPPGNVDRRFGWTIKIVQRNAAQLREETVLQFTRQRLAPTDHTPQTAACFDPFLGEEDLQHRRHKVKRCDLLLFDQFDEIRAVAMSTWTCQHQRSARHQRPEKLPN